MSEKYIQIITTTDKKADAEKIARELVEQRLAGCVQILGPMASVYWWKGKVETAEEWLCLIKSKMDQYEKLEKTIKNMHPYETPEIIAMPIVAGSKGYLEWLNNEIAK